MSAVLLVQDDEMLHDQWTEALSRNGHEVLSVRNVADGIARAREGGIDVVVLDAAGSETAVRELVAELERLPDGPPLVLVSESPNAPELSARVGAAGFVPKPCSSEDLVDVVTRVTSASVRVHPFDEETTSPRRKY